METWIREGIEGRSLRAILKLYLLGACFVALLAILLIFMFDVPTAFAFTPALVGVAVLVSFASAYLGTSRYVATEPLIAPMPWLSLLNCTSDATCMIAPSVMRAYELNNEGAELADRFGKWSEALDLFDQSLGVNPLIPETWSNRAISLWQLGRIPNALACINQALAINPESAELWFNRSLASWKLGLNEKAIGFLKRAVEIKPQFAMVWFSKDSDYEEALTSYDQALVAGATPMQLWLIKAHLLLSLERHREALECFQIASELGSAEAAEEMIRLSRMVSPR